MPATASASASPHVGPGPVPPSPHAATQACLAALHSALRATNAARAVCLQDLRSGPAGARSQAALSVVKTVRASATHATFVALHAALHGFGAAATDCAEKTVAMAASSDIIP